MRFASVVTCMRFASVVIYLFAVCYYMCFSPSVYLRKFVARLAYLNAAWQRSVSFKRYSSHFVAITSFKNFIVFFFCSVQNRKKTDVLYSSLHVYYTIVKEAKHYSAAFVICRYIFQLS
jgi:hypothetical protein